jgi:hypothetical protein
LLLLNEYTPLAPSTYGAWKWDIHFVSALPLLMCRIPLQEKPMLGGEIVFCFCRVTKKPLFQDPLLRIRLVDKMLLMFHNFTNF